MNAPREWWIGWNDTVTPINHKDETLDTKYRVIEKSAYDQLQAKLAVARGALEWYASREAWTIDEVEGSHGDYGQKASNALAEIGD